MWPIWGRATDQSISFYIVDGTILLLNIIIWFVPNMVLK